jgi:hypothetical protein
MGCQTLLPIRFFILFYEFELLLTFLCSFLAILLTRVFLFAEACRSNERDFLPSLEGFFEDAIIELDPRSGVGPLLPLQTVLRIWGVYPGSATFCVRKIKHIVEVQHMCVSCI